MIAAFLSGALRLHYQQRVWTIDHRRLLDARYTLVS